MKDMKASGTPRDQQWLQEVCELVKNKMPENYAFVVFGFPTEGTDRIYYASNAEREDVMLALKVWIDDVQQRQDWLKHKGGF